MQHKVWTSVANGLTNVKSDKKQMQHKVWTSEANGLTNVKSYKKQVQYKECASEANGLFNVTSILTDDEDKMHDSCAIRNLFMMDWQLAVHMYDKHQYLINKYYYWRSTFYPENS